MYVSKQPAVDTRLLEFPAADRGIRAAHRIPVAVQQPQVDAGFTLEGLAGQRTCQDFLAGKRPAPEGDRFGAVRAAVGFPPATCAQETKCGNVPCQAGQDLDVVVAGDADDFYAGFGKLSNALLQFPVGLEEIVFPLDYVSGKQYRPDSGIGGNLYGALPGPGRAQVAGPLREFSRQPGRCSSQVYVADGKYSHGVKSGPDNQAPDNKEKCFPILK